MNSHRIESSLQANLAMPIFVTEGQNVEYNLKSPGARVFSLDRLLDEAGRLCELEISSLVVYELTDIKDVSASQALRPNSLMERTISALKSAHPKLSLVCDLCICHYTTHGHCGIYIDHQFQNDRSLGIIGELSHRWGDVGADILMISGMLDGGVATVRTTLDKHGYKGVLIMSQSAKYASALFAPFRKNIASSATEVTKGSYQLDPSNFAEAFREITLDIEEGVDIVAIKPALFGLDLLYAAKKKFSIPLAAFLTSGEHVLLEELSIVSNQPRHRVMENTFESLLRAGATSIITYFAAEYAEFRSNIRK